jgi:hypothetical protein
MGAQIAKVSHIMFRTTDAGECGVDVILFEPIAPAVSKIHKGSAAF